MHSLWRLLFTIYLLSEPSSQNNPQGKLQLIPLLNENSPNPRMLPGCLCVSASFVPIREVSWVPWPSLSYNEIPPVLPVQHPEPQGPDLLCVCTHFTCKMCKLPGLLWVMSVHTHSLEHFHQ